MILCKDILNTWPSKIKMQNILSQTNKGLNNTHSQLKGLAIIFAGQENP